MSASSIHRDREDAAYKLFGGYQINRHLAVEAGYFDLGRSHVDATTVPLGRLTGQTKVRGVNLDLVGTMPLTERLSAQARVGAQYARSSSEFGGTVAVGTVAGRGRHSGSHLKLGLGVQYALSPAMWIRGEVEHYRTKNFANQSDHINVVSLSLVFPFGRAERTRMASAPMPMKSIWPSVMPGAAMVVAAAEAAPLVALAVARQRVSFSANDCVNFGADSITGNYDGSNKHRTVIEADVHVGSNCVLVARVKLGTGGTVGGGSTVTLDTAPGALTVARARQVNVPDWSRPQKR